MIRLDGNLPFSFWLPYFLTDITPRGIPAPLLPRCSPVYFLRHRVPGFAGGWCSCRTVNHKMHRHCSSVWCRASTVRRVHTASCYIRMQQSPWHNSSSLASLEIPDFLEREGSLPRRQAHVTFTPPEPNWFSPRFLQMCFNIIFSTRLLFKVVSPSRLTHRRPVSISIVPTRTVISLYLASCHRAPCYWLHRLRTSKYEFCCSHHLLTYLLHGAESF